MKKLLLTLLVATPALAQEVEVEPVQQKVKFKERTVIEFDGLDVKGATSGPRMAVVFDQGPSDDFNPLIKIRRSFSLEMEQSVDEVK